MLLKRAPTGTLHGAGAQAESKITDVARCAERAVVENVLGHGENPSML
jgi:hypothetical protein